MISSGCTTTDSSARDAYHPLLAKQLTSLGSSSQYISHTIKAGDTLWSLAKRFGTTVADIIEANDVRKVSFLETGQVLNIPRGDGAQPAAVYKTSDNGWVWPVRGKVAVSFGQRKNGLKSYGIDIRARSGGHVVAAAGGVVRKAGPFVGLGNTVVIQHDDRGGVITIYGRLGNIVVSEGDSVEKGQKIASVSSLSKEGVHFRMFRKGLPVNPERYLP